MDVLGLGRLPAADCLGERFITDFLVDFLVDFLTDFLVDLLDSRVSPFEADEADEAIYWRKCVCLRPAVAGLVTRCLFHCFKLVTVLQI